MVAVRGTATMEDVVTDAVAEPVLLDRSEWLPSGTKEQQSQTGESMYAHGGIVAAAAAILTDMDAHGLLAKMLLGDQQQQPSQQSADHSARQSQAPTTQQQQQQYKAPDTHQAGQGSRGEVLPDNAAADAAKGHVVAAVMQAKADYQGWQLVITGEYAETYVNTRHT